MGRRTTAPARLAIGASVATSIVAVGALLSIATPATSGCATQETNSVPDAALPPCDRGPKVFCAEAPAEAPGCNTDEGSSPLLTQLPRAKRYPVGCVVNFVGDRDPEGDCELDAVCRCVVPESPVEVPEDAGAPVDSGTRDAGDAEAGPPPQPPPAATSRPAWSCYP